MARVKECPLECYRNIGGVCKDASNNCIQYVKYRKATGRCETCGEEMGMHLRCPACGALIGPGHIDDTLVSYKNRNICDSCFHAWHLVEKQLDRDVSFTEFLYPKSIKAQVQK